MSKLSAFLHPAAFEEERLVAISDRFVDEEGNPVPFRIRALTQEDIDSCNRMPAKQASGRNGAQAFPDPAEFSRRMVLAAVVEPDFSSKELCEAYGVADPMLVPGRMLLPGEYTRLLRAITDLAGLGNLEDDLKN